ncbi:hypothetical protein CR513_51126, partial [Mucuna pruriens]
MSRDKRSTIVNTTINKLSVAQCPRARTQREQQSSLGSWRSIPQHYKPRVSRRGIRRSQMRRDELEHKRRRWQDLAESTQAALIGQSGNPLPKPLIVQYNLASRFRALLIIQVLATPTYRDNHTIPWRYNEGEIIPISNEKASPTKEVTNIAKIGGVTRSGRVYASEAFRKKDLNSKKEGKAAENPKENMNKTFARVLLLSLLINSKGHHNLLLKVLNKPHVAQDITIEKFEGIVNNITTNIHLSFSEDEVPTMGRGYNQPFHIAVKCGDYMIARVLNDNGSSLNFMPKATLEK